MIHFATILNTLCMNHSTLTAMPVFDILFEICPSLMILHWISALRNVNSPWQTWQAVTDQTWSKLKRPHHTTTVRAGLHYRQARSSSTRSTNCRMRCDKVSPFNTQAVGCCRMGTAIKHPVPDRIKPSFVIFDIRALWRTGLKHRFATKHELQTTDRHGHDIVV